MLPAMVTLEPMTPDRWARWRAAAVDAYAADKVRVGAWPADGAAERAERAFATLAPDGQATAGHEFRDIVDETGAIVGALWFGPSDAIGRGQAFILDIEVEAAFRGRGHGRAALVALDDLAHELGYDAIGLHVFGDNEVARRLYRSAGYVETDVTMRKRLG